MTITRQPGLGTTLAVQLPVPSAIAEILLRVLLADDHSIVGRGLQGLLEAAGLTVVGEASDGLEAVRLCEEQRPDIVILDIGMPKLSGIEVAARPEARTRAGRDHPQRPRRRVVHHAGARGGARAYLLKSATDEDLIPAVRAVAAGKPFFSPRSRPCSSKTMCGGSSSAG